MRQRWSPAREVIPRRRSAARLVRLSYALSAWSLSGRWRRCPEGVRTAGTRRRPSLRATSVGGSGDLAYTIGYEHITVSMDGGPVAPLTLRVTHLYRREDGEWKIVHRHADRPWRP